MAFVELASFANETVKCEIDVTSTTIRSVRVTNNGPRTVVAHLVNSALGASFRAEFGPGTVVTRNLPAALRSKIQFVDVIDTQTGVSMPTLPGWQLQWTYATDPAKVPAL